MIGALAVDATFGTARRGLGLAQFPPRCTSSSPSPVPPPRCTSSPKHQRPVYQLRIIRCSLLPLESKRLKIKHVRPFILGLEISLHTVAWISIYAPVGYAHAAVCCPLPTPGRPQGQPAGESFPVPTWTAGSGSLQLYLTVELCTRWICQRLFPQLSAIACEW